MNFSELVKLAKPSRAHGSIDRELAATAREAVSRLPSTMQNDAAINANLFRLGQLAVPEDILDVVPSRITTTRDFHDPASLGAYNHWPAGQHPDEVIYNSTVAQRDRPLLTGTPTHEYTHAANYNLPRLLGTSYESAIRPLAEIAASSGVLKSLDFRDPLAVRNRILSSSDVYKNNPLEVVARRMTTPNFNDPSTYPDLRSSFANRLTAEAAETAEQFRFAFPELSRLARPNISNYLPAVAAVAGAAALSPSSADAASSPGPKKSKIDLSANVPGTEMGLVKEGSVPEFFRNLRNRLVDPLVGWETGGRESEIEGESVAGAVGGSVGKIASWFTTEPVAAAMRIGKALTDEEYRGEYSGTKALMDTLELGLPSTVFPAGKAGELGAIQLKGFFSPLAKELKEMRVGKSMISPKMSGEQVLATLRKAGIKDDELEFSGVGEALREVGKEPVGVSRFDDLLKMADEEALGLKREVVEEGGKTVKEVRKLKDLPIAAKQLNDPLSDREVLV